MNQSKVLVLGGTQMLGRDLVETLRDNTNYDITLANRGITNSIIFSELKHIKIDRNHKESCLGLSNISYDFVIDFSCYTTDQFKNTSELIHCNNYIYVSTVSVFDVLDHNYINNDTSHARYLNYCIDKKNIETYILSTDFTHKTFIIRPCAVYGANDYTGRFEQRDNQYYWKNTNTKADEATNCVNVSVVTQKLVEILENKTENNKTKHIINIGKIPNAPISA
jgi:nucleoside-diphosphate-sugar epimerase